MDILFGYPGAAICPFYDALYDSPIRHVLVRSEQNARPHGQRLCPGQRQAGGVRGHLGPWGHQLDHRHCHGLYGLHPHHRHHRPGEFGAAGPGRVPRGGHHRRLRVLYQAQLPGKSVEDLPRVFKEAFHIALHRQAGAGAHRRARGRSRGLGAVLLLPGEGGHPRLQAQDGGPPGAAQACLRGHRRGPAAHHLLRGRCGARRRPGGDDRLRGGKAASPLCPP